MIYEFCVTIWNELGIFASFYFGHGQQPKVIEVYTHTFVL